jgi:hypothetical protein
MSLSASPIAKQPKYQKKNEQKKHCHCTPECTSFIGRVQRLRHYRIADERFIASSTGDSDSAESSEPADGLHSPEHPLDNTLASYKLQDDESDAGDEDENSGREVGSVNNAVESPEYGSEPEDYHDTSDSEVSDDLVDHHDSGSVGSISLGLEFESFLTPDFDIEGSRTSEELIEDLEGLLGPQSEATMYDLSA